MGAGLRSSRLGAGRSGTSAEIVVFEAGQAGVSVTFRAPTTGLSREQSNAVFGRFLPVPMRREVPLLCAHPGFLLRRPHFGTT